MVESAEAGPSRKRSRADENNDGGISQQMERLQLQDTLIKVQIYLSHQTVAPPSKNLLLNIQYLFAKVNHECEQIIHVCKYIQKWTMNVDKFVFSVYKI